MFKKDSETFGILEIALFNKISLSWQDKRMEVFFFKYWICLLPASVKSVCSLKNTRRSRIKSRVEQLGRNYPWSSMWTSFFPITRTIMLMVTLSFIGIQKFVFLFARLWEITPWSVVLQFAFQFRCSNFAWVLILNLRSFLEDFVFSTTYLNDVPQYDTCMWKDIWSNSPQR